MSNFTRVAVQATGNAALLNTPLTSLDTVLEEFKDGDIQEAATVLTIAGGAVTVTGGYHTLTSETGTSDQLDTINGGVLGQIVYLSATATHTITISNSAGNIRDIRGVNVVMSGNVTMAVMFNGTNWLTMRPGAGDPAIIPHTEFSTDVASITLTGIPSKENGLRLVFGLRTNLVAGQTGLEIEINGVSTGYYSSSFSDPGLGIAETLNIAVARFHGTATNAGFVTSLQNTPPAGRMGVGVIDIVNIGSSDFMGFIYRGTRLARSVVSDHKVTLAGAALIPAASATISSIVLQSTNPGSVDFSLGFYALYALEA